MNHQSCDHVHRKVNAPDLCATADDKFYHAFVMYLFRCSHHQIEGGYDAKSNDSVWDDWADKNDISNSAADHYTLWQSDVQLLKDLGVSHYRMSISWTR